MAVNETAATPLPVVGAAAPDPVATPSPMSGVIQQVATAALAGEQAVMTAPTGNEPSWTKPVVVILSQMTLLGVVVFAIVTKNEALIMLTVGAVIAMAQQATGYYIGSSAGSDRKTELLAASSPPVVKTTT